jgi:hypothetical protein
MKSLKLLFLILITTITISGNAKAEFFSDVIVTSPNGIWTDSRAYASLNAAITAVGANQRTVTIVSPQVVTTLTVPANVTLKFERDGSITNSGQLTINTLNIIADNHQIFTGTGDIDFAQGTIVKSSWFAGIYEAITLTSDDIVTMLITKQETLHTSVVVGNNVTLKWDSQLMLGTAAGITMSNIGQVEAGLYQIFSGAGNFRFRDGTTLDLSWFAHLRSAINHISINQINLKFQGTHTVDYSDTIPANIKLISNKGILSISAGIILTFSGQRLPLSAFDSLYLLSIRSAGNLTLDIDKNEIVSINTTIGTGISINSVISNILTVSTGVVLTINGPSKIGMYQVFNCVGTGSVVFGSDSINEAYPEWWWDGVSDYGISINNALTSTSRVSLQAGKTYNISTTIIIPTGKLLDISKSIISSTLLPVIQFGNTTDTSITGTLMGYAANITVTSVAAGSAIVSSNKSTSCGARIYGFPKILGTNSAGSVGIDASGFYRSYIEVHVDGFATGILYDCTLSSCYYNTLMKPDIRIDNAGGVGIKLDGGAINGLTIVSPFINGGADARYGIYLNGVGSVQIIGGYVEAFKADDTDARGIYINDSSAVSVSGTTFDSLSSVANYAVETAGTSTSISFNSISTAGGWASSTKIINHTATGRVYMLGNSYRKNFILGKTTYPASGGVEGTTYTNGLNIEGPVDHTASVSSAYALKFNNTAAEGNGLFIETVSTTAHRVPLALKRAVDGIIIDLQSPAATGNVGIFVGAGSPEGVYTAKIGSLYLRTNGGAGTCLYIKESGSNTNTGWVAK